MLGPRFYRCPRRLPGGHGSPKKKSTPCLLSSTDAAIMRQTVNETSAMPLKKQFGCNERYYDPEVATSGPLERNLGPTQYMHLLWRTFYLQMAGWWFLVRGGLRYYRWWWYARNGRLVSLWNHAYNVYARLHNMSYVRLWYILG